ncbi:DUF998 domain-containing protein [Streptomyces sp. NPDC047049]|uniref:DUF998 domain-containing protein n=1 Tax=Streptomyces sp. NPDC047049 TaxID=3156688 RepID=UPI0034061F10
MTCRDSAGIDAASAQIARPWPRRWAQTVNFLFTGLLSLLFAVGLWRAGPSHWGALLIGVWAVGLLGAGAFRTDPVSGYPVGTPDQLQHPTRVGALHDLFSLIGFLALAVACFVFAAPQPPPSSARTTINSRSSRETPRQEKPR